MNYNRKTRQISGGKLNLKQFAYQSKSDVGKGKDRPKKLSIPLMYCKKRDENVKWQDTIENLK